MGLFESADWGREMRVPRRRLLKNAAIQSALAILFGGSTRGQVLAPEPLTGKPDYKSLQSAPEDAFENGSPFAYYGSENPWDRRFFDKSDGSQLIYDRRATGLMLDIVEGRIEDAENHARKLLREMPEDLEAAFILCVCAAKKGEIVEALEHARYAMTRGMPCERFFAGPRAILKPLTDDPQFLREIGGQPPEIIHGPMVGDISDRSVAVWLRTRSESRCTLEVKSQSEDWSNPGRSTVVSLQSNDYVAVLPMAGLLAGEAYDYRIIIGDNPLPHAKGTFRTLHSPRSEQVVKIGFGGCAGYAPWNERIWDRIDKEQFDIFAMLGDNVYITLPGFPNDVHDYAYYRRQSRPEFRRLTASTPIATVWDDHDAGMDDCWLGPYIEKPAWKVPMVKHFSLQWCNGRTGSQGRPGHWRSYRSGSVEIFLLDGRTYRTNPFAPHPSMLGPEQKDWLLNGLRNSTASLKIVASPVAWHDLAKLGTRDGWSGFPDERNEIFRHIVQYKIDGVVLLSSDRHRGDVWSHEIRDCYPIYEFSSALLTHDYKHELKPEAIFSYNEKCHYVSLEFSTNPYRSLTVKYLSIDGEAVFERRIPFSAISFNM